jgi:hypothetical protein
MINTKDLTAFSLAMNTPHRLHHPGTHALVWPTSYRTSHTTSSHKMRKGRERVRLERVQMVRRGELTVTMI